MQVLVRGLSGAADGVPVDGWLDVAPGEVLDPVVAGPRSQEFEWDDPDDDDDDDFDWDDDEEDDDDLDDVDDDDDDDDEDDVGEDD